MLYVKLNMFVMKNNSTVLTVVTTLLLCIIPSPETFTGLSKLQ